MTTKIMQKLIAHPFVEEVSDERRPGDVAAECDGDGIWAYLHPGLWSPDMECHLVHEWTMENVFKKLKYVEACPCDECQKIPRHVVEAYFKPSAKKATRLEFMGVTVTVPH